MGEVEIAVKLLSRSEELSEDINLKTRVWLESKKLWVVALPAIFTRISLYGMFVIAQGFIGHISDTELAALALVFHVFMRFAIGILMGMSSGLETLCGQAFGAKQYHMLGIYLQRSWLVSLAFSIPIFILFMFVNPILRHLGQTQEISAAAGTIGYWYLPIVLAYVFCYTLQMYLQTQSKNMIITWLALVSLVVHILGSWIFGLKLGYGLGGVMVSMIIAIWIPILGQFVFIFCGWCPLTWKGFTKSAFVDLWPVVKLSVSSGVMLCIELWYNSILILLTGSLKNADIAIDALSICLNITGWQMMVSFGFLAAASVRVSNELGRGSAKAATFSVLVVVCTSMAFGLVPLTLVLVFRSSFSYVFSNSSDVAKMVSQLSPLLATTLLFNSIQPVLSGVAVGAGWQGKVAYVNIVCYYLVGLPLGIGLFYLGMHSVKGIWTGMIGGVVAQTLVLSLFTWRTDWDLQVTIAKERVNRWLVPTTNAIDSDTS